MKKINSLSSVVSTVCNLLLVIMWTYAAISKLLDYQNFRQTLMSHKLIEKFADVLAWLVPAVELAIVGLLLSEQTRRVGYWLSAGLLLIFTCYIVYMFSFYPKTPCSCGGIIGDLGWRAHIVFNICFIAIALAGLSGVKNSSRLRAAV